MQMNFLNCIGFVERFVSLMMQIYQLKGVEIMLTKGILYGVGVGPGDPELLTLKAVRTIDQADVIALPKTDESYITALEIVKSVLDISRKEILEIYLPMTKNEEILRVSHHEAAVQLSKLLEQDKNIAFLTLGDPSIYSTYIYLHEWIIEKGHKAQLVPGVPSFCAVAAKLNISLCKRSEPLHIIPASYQNDEGYLDWEGTKILMKSGKSLTKVINLLQDKGLIDNSCMVERCGMTGEKIYTDLAGVDCCQSSYFSTIVVKDKNEENLS